MTRVLAAQRNEEDILGKLHHYASWFTSPEFIRTAKLSVVEIERINKKGRKTSVLKNHGLTEQSLIKKAITMK